MPTQQGSGDIDVSTVPRMCHEDELFDIIHDAHLSVGHGKAEKTYDYLKKRFSNVSRSVCDLFIKCCTCQTSVPRPARPAVFLLQGAPLILQSDNGKEFVAKVIHELKLLWPKCKLVNGSPR